MAKEFWLNLPVKNLEQSKAFFSSIGFTFNSKHGNTESSAAMQIGDKNVTVMLFEEPMFCGFTNSAIANTQQGTEVLLSFDAQSKEEVDQIAELAKQAGGQTSHKPSPMKGWMYGCVFSDLDGHKWNVLYMDYAQMPQ